MSHSKSSVLQVKNLSKTIADHKILKDISFELLHSSSLSVLGHSGCGKSVLIKCICGLMKPDPNTSVIFEDEDIAFKPLLNREKFNKEFGLLFQGNALFDSLPVWQNIGFSMLNTHSKDEVIAAAQKKLQIVDLHEATAHKMPSSLSGGMQKRVALARALIGNPKILFLDEPTSGLDPVTAQNIAELIKHVKQTFDMSVLSITHDPIYASIVSDHIAFIESGTIVWHGKKTQVKNTKHDFLKGFSL